MSYFFIGNSIFRRGGGSLSTYWSSLISATVENTDPTKVVMTFGTANTSLAVADFSILVTPSDSDGFYLSLLTLTRDATNKILTLELANEVIYGDSIAVVFNKTGGTATVTNNVAELAEITTYTTGLTTPLSAEQKSKLNGVVLFLHEGLAITALTDFFDCLYALCGETVESSYKNLVKNAHHITDGAAAPTWTINLGIKGNGSTQYVSTNYKPKSQGSNFVLDSATIGGWCNSNIHEAATDIGARKDSVDDRTFIQIWSTSSGSSVLAYINTDDNLSGSIATTASIGGFAISRSAANLTTAFYNSLQLGQINIVSSDLPDFDMFICALNNAGTPVTHATKEYAFVYFAKAINLTKHCIISNAFKNYFLSAKSIANSIRDKVGYCWFTNNMALYNSTAGKTWIGLVYLCTQHILTINDDGTSFITKVGSTTENDDHNQPSILVKASDSKLFTAYTEHSLSTSIRYRTSVNALDASSWGAEATFVGTSIVSYANSFQVTNGDIYIVYREYTAGWCYIKSSDNGATFGGRTVIFRNIDSSRYPGYLKWKQSATDPDIIQFVVSGGHPTLNAETISVFAFYMDCSDDKFYLLDGIETTANLPFTTATDVTSVMVNTLDDTGWIEDITIDTSGNPRYLITFYPDGKDVAVNCINKDLYYAEWNGTTITTPHKIHTASTVNITGNDITKDYPPLACFNANDPDEIIASKLTDGICELYKITRIAADDFTSVAITSGSTYDKWRPITVAKATNNLFYLNKVFYDTYRLFRETLGMMTA